MPQQNKNLSLYQESQAKDNCGFGLIVNRHGEQNRDVVVRSITGLTSMTHRGAIGADGKTGDGCGLLFDLNQKFFQKKIKKELKIQLPELFGVAQIFSSNGLQEDLSSIKKILKSENLIFECTIDEDGNIKNCGGNGVFENNSKLTFDYKSISCPGNGNGGGIEYSIQGNKK